MTRRICCYVAFVTLIWSANTQDKEKVPDNMFKSNMTRNDFSNLLQSLIKLNEQRVSVLQRLYKLEDYGVLSEVLRSGDNQPAENGNPNNLFLIVMSKGSVDARTIVKKYQVLRDDEETQPAEDEHIDERLYDLLGLVTLKDHKTLTRRNNEDGDSASVESDSKEDGSIEEEQRSHVKRHHSNHKSKTKSKKSKKKAEVKSRRQKALRERDEREEVKKEIKATCVIEIDNKAVKCIKACRRTQRDVCTRLTCSDRSIMELRKECDISCKESFVPEAC